MNEQGSLKKKWLGAADFTTIGGVIDALYEVISFPPGGRPDWEGLRELFAHGGRLIPPKDKAGSAARVMDVEAFIAWGEQVFEQGEMRARGFYENDTHRVVETFGDIAHVFSTYESRFTRDDPAPFERGINSIQLVREGGLWKALTILWDIENSEKPVPEKYL
jgi:hypothetical protein